MTESSAPDQPDALSKPKLQQPRWKIIQQEVQKHFTTFLTMTLVGLITLFSGSIVESVKFQLNRADLRSERYQSLSVDLSSYVFSVEIVQEFLQENWTPLGALEQIIPQYNTAITNLRKNEYVYLQWLHQYWDERKMDQFNEIMEIARQIDHKIHSLNDEFGRVRDDNKNYPRVNEERARKVVAEIKPLLESLQEKTQLFLNDLR
jgi:hypothetical protein